MATVALPKDRAESTKAPSSIRTDADRQLEPGRLPGEPPGLGANRHTR